MAWDLARERAFTAPAMRRDGDVRSGPGSLSHRSVDALVASDPFESTFESARVGLAIVDLQGAFVRVNEAYARLMDLTPPDLVGAPFTIEPEQLTTMLRGEHSTSREFEREVNGRWLLQGVTLAHTAAGTPAWFVVDAQDISDRHRAESELTHRALHDQLTGLANRVLAVDRLRLALARARRQRTHVGLLFLDLDGFKEVNDRHGHLLGDIVLQVVGRRIAAAVRPSDTVARLGGDEFLVIVEPPVDEPQVLDLVERIRTTIEAPLRERGTDTRVGASIGYAVSSGDREVSAEALIARADEAMYVQKRRLATAQPAVQRAPGRPAA